MVLLSSCSFPYALAGPSDWWRFWSRFGQPKNHLQLTARGTRQPTATPGPDVPHWDQGEPNTNVWRVFCGPWNGLFYSRAQDRGSVILAANTGQLITRGMVSPRECPWSHGPENLPVMWQKLREWQGKLWEPLVTVVQSEAQKVKQCVEDCACSHFSLKVWWNEKETSSNKRIGGTWIFSSNLYLCFSSAISLNCFCYSF